MKLLLLLFLSSGALANTLGDRVWHDLNGNGLIDVGEPGVAGVTVDVVQCNGPFSDTATTNSNGIYLFTVPDGRFKLIYGLPSGYAFTIQDAGKNSKDSDPNPTTGETGCIFVSGGVTKKTWDAGLIRGGSVEPTIPERHSLSLVDANGKYIGTVEDIYSKSVYVVMRPEGYSQVLQGRARSEDWGGGFWTYVYFSNSGCTGDAAISLDASGGSPITEDDFVLPFGRAHDTLYVPGREPFKFPPIPYAMSVWGERGDACFEYDSPKDLNGAIAVYPFMKVEKPYRVELR